MVTRVPRAEDLGESLAGRQQTPLSGRVLQGHIESMNQKPSCGAPPLQVFLEPQAWALEGGCPASLLPPRATCNTCFLALALVNSLFSFAFFSEADCMLACLLIAGAILNLSRLLTWAFRPLSPFLFQIPHPSGEKVCTDVRVPGPLVS